MLLLNFKLSDFFSEPTFISILTGVALAIWLTLRNKKRKNQTALLDAASNNDLEKFKFELAKKNVDVNQLNLNKYTPLILATVKFGQKYLIEELLEKGALINWQDIEGNTALHYAVDQNNKTLVKVFMENGANTTLQNKEGKTPLDLATDEGRADLMELLKIGDRAN